MKKRGSACHLAGAIHRLSFATVIAVTVPLALAQDPPKAAPEATPAARANRSGSALEEITITARRVSENLQEVPVAVTAFSAADLTNQGVQVVQDIAKFAPGLSIRQASSTPSALVITMRGQVQNDTVATLDPSVGTYVDGMYWARAYGLNGDILDVKSVQVLRGPQGTLFGRNTTGGAILFETNDPEMDDLSGKVSLTYGRFNELQATAVANIPIIADKVALRLAGQTTNRDGHTTNTVDPSFIPSVPADTNTTRTPSSTTLNGTDINEVDRESFRGKLLIEPTDRLSLMLSGEYFNMDELTPARSLIAVFPSYSAAAGAPGIAPPGAPCSPGAASNACANTTYSVGGTSAFVVGNGNSSAGFATLANEAMFANDNEDKMRNNDASYATARTSTWNFIGNLDTEWGAVKLLTNWRKVSSLAGVDLDGSSYGIIFTEGKQSLKQYSAELQATGKLLDDRLDFAVGAFGFHEEGYDRSLTVSVPNLNPNTAHTYSIIDNDSTGAYGQATYHFTDKLSATAGLRYSVDEKGLESRNNNYNRSTGTTTCLVNSAGTLALGGAVIAPEQCAITRSDSFEGTSYTVGIEYKPTDDIMLYVKTSKGFRSGGQNARAPRSAAFLPFEPESALSYELGAKTELFDRFLRLNASIYHTDVSDLQRTLLIGTASGGTATIVGNAGKARFKGFEGEFTMFLTEGLRLSGSVAYVDPSYESFEDLSGDRSFERFRDVTEWEYSLAADYETWIADNRYFVHIGWSWTDEQPADGYYFPANPGNGDIVDATTLNSIGLLGARAGISFNKNRYELAIFGRNITNERDYTNVLGVMPLGFASGTRMEPATYGLTATMSF